jgi:hypothetical protein
MEMMGHGHGLDQERTLQLFGEKDTITYAELSLSSFFLYSF